MWDDSLMLTTYERSFDFALPSLDVDLERITVQPGDALQIVYRSNGDHARCVHSTTHVVVDKVYSDRFLCRVRDDPIADHSACCRHVERGLALSKDVDVRVMDCRVHRIIRHKRLCVNAWRPVRATAAFLEVDCEHANIDQGRKAQDDIIDSASKIQDKMAKERDDGNKRAVDIYKRSIVELKKECSESFQRHILSRHVHWRDIYRILVTGARCYLYTNRPGGMPQQTTRYRHWHAILSTIFHRKMTENSVFTIKDDAADADDASH